MIIYVNFNAKFASRKCWEESLIHLNILPLFHPEKAVFGEPTAQVPARRTTVLRRVARFVQVAKGGSMVRAEERRFAIVGTHRIRVGVS